MAVDSRTGIRVVLVRRAALTGHLLAQLPLTTVIRMRSLPIAVRTLLAAIVVAIPALSGCGAPHAGHTAETGAEPPDPVPMPATTRASLPPRPFSMSLHEVDACEALSAEQRAQLGFDRDPLRGVEPGFDDAATCSYRNSSAKVGARLALVTGEGIGVWTSDTAQVEATPVRLAGFPALVVRTPRLDMACNVAVDVAEGQHLDVLYRDDGGTPAPPLDQLCAGARRIAEAAVTNLRGSSTTAPSIDR